MRADPRASPYLLAALSYCCLPARPPPARPNKDGDEVVAQMRRFGCDRAFLAVTGTSEAGVRARLLQCGFDDVLTKPFTLRELRDALNRFVARAGPGRRDAVKAVAAVVQAAARAPPPPAPSPRDALPAAGPPPR